MKKLLALVSLLAVGILVGCGGEKPKAVKTPDPTKLMDDMKAATGGAIEDLKKTADDAGKTVEGAVKEAAEGVEKTVKEETEKAKEEIKEAAEGAEKAIKEGAEKAKEEAKEAVEGAKEAAKEAAGDK